MFVFLDDGNTELRIDPNPGGGYCISVTNQYINYRKDFDFTDDDEKFIAQELQEFMDGECDEVKVVGTSQPFLTLVLCPSGAKSIRELGDDVVRYGLDDKPIEEYYEQDTIQIELDLCVNGVYGGQFWVAVLSEDETEDFCQKWITEFGDGGDNK